jgi:Caspase domain
MFWQQRIYRYLVMAAWLGHSCLAHANERIALVIGNSSYAQSPLVNPKNDAASMSKLLKEAGFDVMTSTDAHRAQMQRSVETFGQKVRQSGVKFALFYYAGHGVQQDWRNFLIPVDANIRKTEDIRSQGVDVTELVSYMQNQKGKSFLVILDACRDDPFADQYKPSAKGLSQFDAPVGSMLAYSTSPGKVALDGDGVNGLYTTYLLRELAVKSAKLEDVFKRVRLSVRLASNGLQVPWETTSLEEDVYLHGGSTRNLSTAEHEQELQKELAAWNRVKDSQDHVAITNFLREFPSGNMSELAQAKLSRVLSVQAANEIVHLIRKSASLADAERVYKSKLDEVAKEAKAAAAAREAAARAEEARAQAALALQKAQEQEQSRLAQARIAQEKALAAQRETERLAQEQAKLQAQRQADQAAESRIAQEKALLAQREAERLAQDQARRNAEQEALKAAELRKQESERLALAQAAAQKAEAEKQLAAQRQEEQQAQLRIAAQKALDERLAAARKELNTQTLPVSMVLAAPEMVLAATPNFAGQQSHDRRFSEGDVYEMRVIERFNKSEQALSYKVTAVDESSSRVEYNGGEYVSDLMGNILRNTRGSSSTPRQFYPAELAVGKRWNTVFVQERAGGIRYTFSYTVRVVAKERITVPAGSFEAYRIQADGYNMQLGAKIERTIWVAPGINPDIAQDYKVTLNNNRIDEWTRTELVKFQQKAASGGMVAAR